jgi:hypothetical protein
VEYSARLGRHAVANRDLPPGTLVLVERPFLALPLNKFAAIVCHRCLKPLQHQQNGGVPSGGNPCLPRHCAQCKQHAPTDLDTKLASLRIKLLEISEANSLDPIILHIPLLLDLQRAGVPGAGAYPPDRVPQASSDVSELRCTVTDYDSLSSHWDRRPELWRKKVGAALRSLHKEMVALAASGSIPQYTQPSPITRLQADAAVLSAHLHPVGPVGFSTDTGVGIFPALSVLQHSCLPNCWFTSEGPLLRVRTIVDVPAGTPLTVTYVPWTEPRSSRQQALRVERQLSCACERCSEPLESSNDRFLEGMLCLTCGVDVMLPVEVGAANDEAAEEWKQRVRKELEEDAARNARRAGRSGKKKGARGGGDPNGDADDGEQDDREPAPNPADLPEGVMFWRCCRADCRAVEPAHNVRGTGPGDVAAQTGQTLQRGLMLMSIRQPEVMAQGEALLESVVEGMGGRLPVFHHYYMDALAPLINASVRKGEAVKVINYSIQLFDSDRQLFGRPTTTQLRCLQAMVEAAEAKASSASSAVIKRQFARRLKMAMTELHLVKHALLGTPLPPSLAAAAAKEGAAQEKTLALPATPEKAPVGMVASE